MEKLSLSRMEFLYYRLFNTRLSRNRIVTLLINFFSDIVNIIKCIFGVNAQYTGSTRLIFRLYYYIIHNYDDISVKPSGIYSKGKLIDSSHLPVFNFMYTEGINAAKEKSVLELSELIDREVTRENWTLSRKYFLIRGLGGIVISASFLINFYLGYKLVFYEESRSSFQTFLHVIWYIVNVLFFLNTILLFYSWTKYLSLNSSFREASDEEEQQFYELKEHPSVITIIPTYMEDDELVKRALYSVCLQKYANNKVVLLLGNDIASKDEVVINNTAMTRKMVIRIKRELKQQNLKIKRCYKSFLEVKEWDADSLIFELIKLSRLYNSISNWFYNKAEEFKDASVKYPFDEYLIENTFLVQYEYYKMKVDYCLFSANNIRYVDFSDKVRDSILNELEKHYLECTRVFKTKLEVFMRTKYANLEQEKTKAGNLTAYTSIMGGTWKKTKNENGEYILVPASSGKRVEMPEYLAVFDCDSVARYNYLSRKVIYMQKPENEKAGLIQSPYDVPCPEPTPVAAASGVMTAWFKPLSVALSTSKSSFWLGYNGLFRGEAVKKMGSFLAETIIEDVENTIKLDLNGYHVVTSHENQCFTFSPVDLRSLQVQRTRWASGGLRIEKNIINHLRHKRLRYTVSQAVLKSNYILGLTSFPIATTITWVLKTPFNSRYHELQAAPFLFFMVSYVCLIPAIAKEYKNRNLIDAMSVSIFMNFYHLRGLYKSIKVLFREESKKKKFFKSTPRPLKKSKMQLGYFEIIGIIVLIIWNLYHFISSISGYSYYLDYFAMTHLFLIFWGLIIFLRNKSTLEESPGPVKKEQRVKADLAVSKRKKSHLVEEG
ncbi:MAG: glycosyltransferase family 2 protein [Bacillota bacterium]